MFYPMFWSFTGVQRPISVTDVAKKLNIDPGIIHAIFKEWAKAGNPNIYRMELEPKKWLQIFIIENDYVGWLEFVRPWGKSWRRLPTKSQFFTLEVSV